MLTFEQPVYLFLFAVLPFLVYVNHFMKRRGGAFPFPFRLWNGTGFYPKVSGLRVVLAAMTIMQYFAVLFFILGLASPIYTEREIVYLNKGIDIMFVFDQSPSMAGADFPPDNRFSTAKDMIRKFVYGRKNDSIGLVGFGDDAVLRVPPTTDYNFFIDQMDSLKVMEMGEGTAIGMGLAVANLHLLKTSGSEKIIVLLTDGDNNSGEIPPLMAANTSAEMRIRIYCVGIGSDEDVPVLFNHPETGDEISGILKSNFNESLLRAIATRTGGEYFRAISPVILETIFQTIDSLETVETQTKMQVRTSLLHKQFILIGLLLTLFPFFVRKVLLREVV